MIHIWLLVGVAGLIILSVLVWGLLAMLGRVSRLDDKEFEKWLKDKKNEK